MSNFRKDQIIRNRNGQRVWIDVVHGNGVYTVHIGENGESQTMYQDQLEEMQKKPGKNKGGRNNKEKNR